MIFWRVLVLLSLLSRFLTFTHESNLLSGIKNFETVHMKIFTSNYHLPTRWGEPYKPLLTSIHVTKRSRDLPDWYPHRQAFQISHSIIQAFEQYRTRLFINWWSLNKLSSVGAINCTSSECPVMSVWLFHITNIRLCSDFWMNLHHESCDQAVARAMVCEAHLTQWEDGNSM